MQIPFFKKRKKVVVAFRSSAHEPLFMELYSDFDTALKHAIRTLNTDYNLNIQSVNDLYNAEIDAKWYLDIFELDDKKINSDDSLKRLY